MEHETYRLAWNQGFLSGVSFACTRIFSQETAASLIETLMKEWAEELKKPLMPIQKGENK